MLHFATDEISQNVFTTSGRSFLSEGSPPVRLSCSKFGSDFAIFLMSSMLNWIVFLHRVPVKTHVTP